MNRSDLLAALASLPAHERAAIVCEANSQSDEDSCLEGYEYLEMLEEYHERTYNAREDLSECRNWMGEI